MYDYNFDDGINSRSEYRAARREDRARRRAIRRGIYPEPTFTSPDHDTADAGYPSPGQVNFYSPAQPQAAYPAQQPQQQQIYRRAASLTRQRTLLISNAISCVIFCSFLVLAWAMSGATYFWPGWIIFLWALALLSQASAYFVRRNIS